MPFVLIICLKSLTNFLLTTFVITVFVDKNLALSFADKAFSISSSLPRAMLLILAKISKPPWTLVIETFKTFPYFLAVAVHVLIVSSIKFVLKSLPSFASNETLTISVSS